MDFPVLITNPYGTKRCFQCLQEKDASHEDKAEEIAGVKILKSAVIYGANGSGKSNLINAISFVRNLKSVNHQPGQGIRQVPHKLDGYEKESAYKIQFVTEGVRYVFGFTLKNMLVAEEYLYYFPSGRQTKIFERTGMSSQQGVNSGASLTPVRMC